MQCVAQRISWHDMVLNVCIHNACDFPVSGNGRQRQWRRHGRSRESREESVEEGATSAFRDQRPGVRELKESAPASGPPPPPRLAEVPPEAYYGSRITRGEFLR